MKKEKNLEYYRRLLHKDSITLLILSIIFSILSLLFEDITTFLASIIFIIVSIIIICNKKETKKFIGVLSALIGGLMILTLLGGLSLFSIIYFPLGIFLEIHSIIYLNKFKK